MDIATVIDHTCLRPDATAIDIDNLCAECVEYGFFAAVVAPSRVEQAVNRLSGFGVRIATVVGFPHGNTSSATKCREAEIALSRGACEIDMVMNIGAFLDNDDDAVIADIAGVAETVHSHAGALVKVILETALLPTQRIAAACAAAEAGGADFVKTSTGFAGGATVEVVALMAQTVSSRLGVKAAGGIRDLAVARRMLDAGATRIGASASVAIARAAAREAR